MIVRQDFVDDGLFFLSSLLVVFHLWLRAIAQACSSSFRTNNMAVQLSHRARNESSSVRLGHIVVLVGLVCFVVRVTVNPFTDMSLKSVAEMVSTGSLSGCTTVKKPDVIPKSYTPSKIEKYFLDHGEEMGLNDQEQPSAGCTLWKDENSPLAAELKAFREGMKAYKEKLQELFAREGEVKDLREEIATKGDYSVCDTLEFHPDGLNGLFPLQTLTQTSNSLLEPIFPPMRDPSICWEFGKHLMSMDYLIQDFAAYCRMLTPRSRIVLVDMGASLNFHSSGVTPAVYLTQIFEKAGFHFDHIYAYEITFTDPKDVVNMVPDWLAPAYHWINVPVDPDMNSKQNPFRMLLNEFNENDFGEFCVFFFCAGTNCPRHEREKPRVLERSLTLFVIYSFFAPPPPPLSLELSNSPSPLFSLKSLSNWMSIRRQWKCKWSNIFWTRPNYES